MRTVQLVFYPVVVGLNGLGNVLLRLFGVDRSRAGVEQYRTPEEIALCVISEIVLRRRHGSGAPMRDKLAEQRPSAVAKG